MTKRRSAIDSLRPASEIAKTAAQRVRGRLFATGLGLRRELSEDRANNAWFVSIFRVLPLPIGSALV
jgi:hypothetical protein